MDTQLANAIPALMTVTDIARLFRTSPGAVRTAVWRQLQFGTDPGFPPPLRIRRQLLWDRERVLAHLESLGAETSASEVKPRPGRRRSNK